MKRWLLFPTIALVAVAIGLVWHASLNSPTDLVSETPTTESTQNDETASTEHQETAAAAEGGTDTTTASTNQPRVVATSNIAQPELLDITADFESRLSELEAQIGELQAELETARNTQSDELIGSLNTDELEELVAVASTKVAKRSIQSVAPSVVEVNVETEGTNPFFDQFDFFNQEQPQQRRQGTGSGFFVEFQGERYVLTNHHVVNGAVSITVVPTTGEQFVAEVVGQDAMIDLAVLKVVDGKTEHIPAVTLGDSEALEIGDWVAAIGHPYGLSHTVTTGIVSTLERDIPRPDRNGSFFGMIQTDAAINPGNSGGPLVNASGEVVGINTAIIQNAPGLGFTIAINNAVRLLEELVTTGHYERAWLGVPINEVTPDVAEFLGAEPFRGVWVVDLCVGAPAMGVLKQNDIIYSVDGTDVNTVAELIDSIQHLDAGYVVQLEVWRAGEVIELGVELGVRPPEDEGCMPASQVEESPEMNEEAPVPDESPVAPEAPSEDESPEQDESGDSESDMELLSAFGITVVPNSAELAAELDLPVEAGVVITEIADDSPARRGLRANQVIIQVNDFEIESASDWDEAVEAIRSEPYISVIAIEKGRQSQAFFYNPDQ